MEIDLNGREKKEHGDKHLPLDVYDITLTKREGSIRAHWHKEIEIILVTYGNLKIKIDTQCYCCKEGDLIFINPEEIHHFQTLETDLATWQLIIFDISQLYAMTLDRATFNFIAPIINGTNKCTSVITPDYKDYQMLHHLFKTIVETHSQKSYGFELEVKAYLFSFFATLYRNHYIRECKNFEEDLTRVSKVKQVITYIQGHYVQEIKMADLASLCNYNTEYFMKFFKQHTGITCGQFIKAYRLEKAAHLLQTTSKTITEIALDVGFSNVSYFIKSFKSHYHLTPYQYKNTKKQG